jgi:hypothetical protein
MTKFMETLDAVTEDMRRFMARDEFDDEQREHLQEIYGRYGQEEHEGFIALIDEGLRCDILTPDEHAEFLIEIGETVEDFCKLSEERRFALSCAGKELSEAVTYCRLVEKLNNLINPR